MKKYRYTCSKCGLVMNYIEPNLTQKEVQMACPNMCGCKVKK